MTALTVELWPTLMVPDLLKDEEPVTAYATASSVVEPICRSRPIEPARSAVPTVGEEGPSEQPFVAPQAIALPSRNGTDRRKNCIQRPSGFKPKTAAAYAVLCAYPMTLSKRFD